MLFENEKIVLYLNKVKLQPTNILSKVITYCNITGPRSSIHS